MDVYTLNSFDNLPNLEGFSVVLGFFDGIHLGHRTLINSAFKSSQKVAILTFDETVKSLTRHVVLTSLEDRLEIFKQLLVRVTLVFNFSLIRNLSALEFVNLLKKLKINEVYCGNDFRFGHERVGDAKFLQEYGEPDFKTHVIDLVVENQKILSTTFLMDLLKEGNIQKVNHYLSRPYFIKGVVTKGYGLGKKLGYPTANIALKAPYLLPKSGVYIGLIHRQKSTHYALLSVGYHPTVNPLQERILEVYILDFNKDIYGEEIQVDFKVFLREEIKFESVDLLIKQMDSDVLTTREILKKPEMM